MAQRKRTQKNTIAGQVETTKALQEMLEPAYELTEAQRKYFDRIVKSRETSTWDDNHILLATNLAVNYLQVDEANEHIEQNGLMVLSEKGWPVTNPAIQAKQSLMSSILQLNKALGLSASQKGVSGKDQDSRNKAERETRRVLDKVSAEDLI